MDGARQLIRYSLPGGLFSLLVILFQLALHWAWGNFDGTLDVLLDHALAVLAASIIFGFVIYQVYYAMYGPFIRLPLLLRWLRLAPTFDRGGEVFSGLAEGERRQLAEAMGLSGSLERVEYERGGDWEHFRREWFSNSHALRCVLDLIAVRGGEEIKRNYVTLSDIYHALGACRYASLFAFLGTGAYLAFADRWDRFDSPLKAGVAIGGCVLVTWFMVAVCHLNRADTWHTMTKQLRADLHAWMRANPSFPNDPVGGQPAAARRPAVLANLAR